MSHLWFCPHCQRYTLHNSCPTCTRKTRTKKPARFSPQDHYGKYRRQLKQLEKNG